MRALAIILLLLCSARVAEAATSVVHDDITWNFDMDSTVGAFLNGDPWVVVPSGSINVTSTVPAPLTNCGSGSNLDCHGVQKNPSVSDFPQLFAGQGLDERALSYDVNLNVSGSSISVAAGDSLVKVESRSTGSYGSSSQCQSSQDYTCVESTSILTVLASEPASDAYRPPYVSGTDKTIRTQSELDLTGWPDLNTTVTPPSIAAVNAQWACSSLEHLWHIAARNLRGSECVMELGGGWADYDAELGNVIATTILRTFHDDMTLQQKKDMLTPVIQFAIDVYEMQQVDTTNVHWAQWGGYGAGRKPAILAAGRALNDSGMYGIGTEFTGSPAGWSCGKYWAEDSGTYYGDGSVALFGSADQYNEAPPTGKPRCGCEGSYGGGSYDDNSESGYIYNVANCDRGTDHCRDPDGLNDGDWPDFTTDTCPSEMRTPAQQVSDGTFDSGSYQWCCTTGTWIGEAQAMLGLGMKTLWNNGAFFDYVDRWNGSPWDAACANCEQYNLDMYDELAASAPADWNPADTTLQGGSITGGSLSLYEEFEMQMQVIGMPYVF